MANHTTGAQRYNARMDKIFAEAERLKKDPSVKSFKRHQRRIGVAVKDRGDQYPGAKSKAIAKKGKEFEGATIFDRTHERDHS